MNKKMLEQLYHSRLVIIARGIETQQLVEVAKSLQTVGIQFLETTFDHRLENCIQENVEKIKALKKAVGSSMYVGAGTVLSVEEVQSTFDAGGNFVLSPSFNPRVVEKTKNLGMLSVPGAMTPSEICNAWDAGADMVKLFPADTLGVGFITSLQGPLPHIPLLATGGVNPDSIPKFMSAGVSAFGTGASVLLKSLLDTNNYEKIAEIAREHLMAIQSIG